MLFFLIAQWEHSSAEEQEGCLRSPNLNKRGGREKVASLSAGRSVTHLSRGNKEKTKYNILGKKTTLL